MKKLLLMAIWLNLLSQIGKAQVSTAANNVGSYTGQYVGWDASMTSVPLSIKHEAAEPINFYTDAGALGFANLRMLIAANGNIGVGDNTTPLSLFHLHQILANAPTVMHFSNSSIGISVTSGFDFHQEPTGEMLFIQQENKTIRFDAKNNTSAAIQHRLDINSEAFTPSSISWDRTRVWISQQNTSSSPAVSMLQIGDLAARNNAGNRQWMDYGTYIAGGDDNCYFGLKNEDNDIGFLLDHSDAVVNWGDNEITPDNLNDLRFIFTGSFGSGGLEGQMNGLEMARISYNGNFGIGNFYNHSGVGIVQRPARRLEILGDGGSSTTPQFRITFAQRTGSQIGRYTDINATTNGDFAIFPISESTAGVITPRHVGINTATPQRTLEVFENSPDPQFRISNVISATPASRRFADFQSTNLGDLYIQAQNGVNLANVGINTATPQRPFEIYKNSTDPQFRISNVISPTASVRRFADFKSTSSGDLIITTKAGSNDGKVGINTTATPGNTLTINGGTITPGNSGLQFVQLTSAFVPTVPSNGKVLSVDGTGNVFLTNDQGAGSLNTCGGTGNLNHIMKYNNSTGSTACQASMQENANGFVSLGIASPTTNQGLTIEVASTSSTSASKGIEIRPGAFDINQYGTYLKTSVTGSTPSSSYASGHWCELTGNNISNNGYYANIGGGANSRANSGFYANVTGAQGTPNAFNYGAYLYAYGSLATINYGARAHAFEGAQTYGLYGYGQNSVLNHGVYGIAIGTDVSTNYGVYGYTNSDAILNCGVYGTATLGDVAYGVQGIAKDGLNWTIGIIGEASSTNGRTYGVYGNVPVSSCTSGSCPTAAGYFNGAVYGAAAYVTSDIKFKTNINPLNNAIQLLNQLQPKTYDFDTAQYHTVNLSTGLQYGLIAQDVENIFPNAVKEFIQPPAVDTLGNIITPEVSFKALNYQTFIPILIAAMKEQQTLITNQQAQLDSIKNVLASNTPLNNSGNKTTNPNQKIELSNNEGIILNQNDPNPFAESTQITYFIPEDIKEAKIMFSDNKGTVLRSAKLDSRGQGTLEVYASELSSGIYTYTLICDGKVIESKKMMKTK